MNKHLTKSDVERYGLLGDPDFSEARNRAIYKEVERDTIEMHKKKQKMLEEGIAERTDLIYAYIRNQLKYGKQIDITEYAGWYNMKKLWGETRVRELQEKAEQKGFNIKGL